MESSFGDSPLEYLLALAAGLPSSLSISGLQDIPLLAWLLILSIIYLILYWSVVVRRPRLYGGDGGLKQFLLESCPILSEGYCPIPWAWHCHANTVFRAVWQRLVPLKYKRQLLSLPDGGVLALDWVDKLEPHVDKPDTPVLLVMPGLSGSSASNYITQFVSDGLQQNYRPVVLNHRGNGDHLLKTPRTYSATNIDDLKATLETIQEQYPNAKIVTVAVSLGSMQVVHYLHEAGDNSALSAAMLISIVWDPFSSQKQLEHKFFNRALYVQFLLMRVKQMIKRNLNIFKTSKEFDIDRVLQCKLISEMDDCFTVPMFGYPSLNEYYSMAMMGHKLRDIKRPVLAVNAIDDPFVPCESLPIEAASSNPLTVLAVTKHGGHFGFMEGISPRGPSWMNRVCRQFLSAVKHIPSDLVEK